MTNESSAVWKSLVNNHALSERDVDDFYVKWAKSVSKFTPFLKSVVNIVFYSMTMT